MEKYDVQGRIDLLKLAPNSTSQRRSTSLNMGCASRALDHALSLSTKNNNKRSADDGVFVQEKGLPGLINAPADDDDQLTGSNYWLSSEAPNHMPDFEEVLADWVSALSSCPSDGVAPQPVDAEDDAAPKEPDFADHDGVAPQQNLANFDFDFDFDFDTDIEMDDEMITSVMSIIDD